MGTGLDGTIDVCHSLMTACAAVQMLFEPEALLVSSSGCFRQSLPNHPALLLHFGAAEGAVSFLLSGSVPAAVVQGLSLLWGPCRVPGTWPLDKH
jgi:hypothetical protein